MKLFRETLDEWVPSLLPENGGNSALSEEANYTLGAVTERLVYSVLKSLETEEQSQSQGFFVEHYDILALALTAALAGCAAAFSPWLTLGTVVIVGTAALLLRKRLLSPRETRVTVNRGELAQSLNQAVMPLAELLNKSEGPGRKEEADIYRIHEDRSFARWLQMFALYVRRNENANLEKLYSQLKDDLENMGIFIYDELETGEDGKIRLPDEGMFLDLRTGDAWTEVKLPVVYTAEKVLMHGQIK